MLYLYRKSLAVVPRWECKAHSWVIWYCSQHSEMNSDHPKHDSMQLVSWCSAWGEGDQWDEGEFILEQDLQPPSLNVFILFYSIVKTMNFNQKPRANNGPSNHQHKIVIHSYMFSNFCWSSTFRWKRGKTQSIFGLTDHSMRWKIEVSPRKLELVF